MYSWITIHDEYNKFIHLEQRFLTNNKQLFVGNDSRGINKIYSWLPTNTTFFLFLVIPDK